MRGGGTNVLMSRNGRLLLLVFFAAFLVFMYLPSLLLAIFSFNESTVIAFPITSLTTDWYKAAWDNHEIRNAIVASLKVGAGTAVIATLIGLLVSYALARRTMIGKGPISAFLLLPLVVPTVVFGVALLVLFRPNNPVIPIPLGLWAVLIGHIVIALPFCVLLLLPRLASIDRRLEEAAHDLGASGVTTFRRIILPLITPALLASLIVAFVISIDEVVIASFVIQDQPTYPVYLYSGLRLGGQTSLLMPVATVMLLVSFVLVLAAELIRRLGERRLGLIQ